MVIISASMHSFRKLYIKNSMGEQISKWPPQSSSPEHTNIIKKIFLCVFKLTEISVFQGTVNIFEHFTIILHCLLWFCLFRCASVFETQKVLRGLDMITMQEQIPA